MGSFCRAGNPMLTAFHAWNKKTYINVVISSWPTSLNQSVACLWKPALGISLQQCLSEALAKETVETRARRRERGASWDIRDISQLRILVDNRTGISQIPLYVEVDRYPAQVRAIYPSPAPRKTIIGEEIIDFVQSCCMVMKGNEVISILLPKDRNFFQTPEVATKCMLE